MKKKTDYKNKKRKSVWIAQIKNRSIYTAKHCCCKLTKQTTEMKELKWRKREKEKKTERIKNEQIPKVANAFTRAQALAYVFTKGPHLIKEKLDNSMAIIIFIIIL